MKIDVKNVVRSKSPGLSKIGPLIRYIRRIAHEEDVNEILELFSHLPSIEFIRSSLSHMGIRYTVVGMEKLDRAGRYIFASNHPFGGLDGLMLAEKVSAYFGDVKVVVNDLLMNIEPLAPIFIPINKHGRQSSDYSKLYNDAFESDVPIVTFPAGLCSRRTGGVVRDLEWKPNFVRQAIATRRDVVPVFFDGRLSSFFYRLSNFRKRLGVKANIEMAYLADEMFKQRGRHFFIVIGDPVPWQELDDGRRPGEHAEELRRRVYSLKKTD